MLQPRVCTLRSYGGDRGGVIRAGGEDGVSRFFEILSDYVESSKKSHDFEIMSGRLAMVELIIIFLIIYKFSRLFVFMLKI